MKLPGALVFARHAERLYPCKYPVLGPEEDTCEALVPRIERPLYLYVRRVFHANQCTSPPHEDQRPCAKSV